jgi:hypothetical protein
MFNSRRSDRRRGYSFLGHLQRVIRTKGLSRVLLSIGGTLLVAVASFAYCGKNTITAPTEPAPKSAPKPQQQSVSAPKHAVAVFPTNLLPSVHPCDPTLAFTDMQGENDVTYTDEMLYNPDGTPSGQHQITYSTTETQSGHDKNGTHYSATKTETPNGFVTTSAKGQNTVSHMDVGPDGHPCSQTTNQSAGTTHGSCFKSSPSYQWMLVEDPITHEGTLTVTPIAITSECLPTIAMLEP